MVTPDRDALCRWDREHVWHAFTQMAEYEELILQRGEGCVLYDLDDRAYLDGVSSLWCNVHGHRHPRLDAALRAQLDKVAHVTLLGSAHPATIQLARRLVEVTPAGLNHVFFASDGSSAVEVALKMAFQYWRQCIEPRPNKTCFVAFGDAYHGDTIGSVSVGGVERFHRLFEPLLFETLRLPSPTGDLTTHVAALESLLEREHERIAAVVIEPLMQCAAGIVRHTSGYLRALRELTRRYDLLLIADEVAVGFGRTGTLFACEHEQVSPDFLCLGKGLTGGYLPMAATLATDEVWQSFLGPYESQRQLFHGHTYGGNPLAAAVALASLDVFAEERVIEQLPEKIAHLEARLRPLAAHPHVGRVTQLGLIAGIELVCHREPRESYPWQARHGQRVCRAAREHGVLLRPLGDVLVLMPPLAITLSQIDQLVDAIEYGIDLVTGQP